MANKILAILIALATCAIGGCDDSAAPNAPYPTGEMPYPTDSYGQPTALD